MRFILLAIGAAATGALSVTGVRTMLPTMGQTFPALSGDQASVKPGDLNPIGATYDSVERQTTLRHGVDVLELPPEQQQVITVGPSSFGTLGPVRYFDSRPVQRIWGGDAHWHVHHDVSRAPEIIHHAAPHAPEFVRHDTPPAHEFHPAAQHSVGGHGTRVSHGGGHGRR